jgi:CHAT domain-containing protein
MASMGFVSSTLKNMGRDQEALAVDRQLYALGQKKNDPTDMQVMNSAMNFSRSLATMNRYDQAIDILQESLNNAGKKRAKTDPGIMATRYQLANALYLSGDYATAEKVIRENIANLSPATDKTAPYLADSKALLSNILAYGPKQDFAQAIKLRDETLAYQLKRVGPDHRITLASQLQRVGLMREAKDDAGADKLLRSILPKLKKAYGEDSIYYLSARLTEAGINRDKGDADKAVAILQESLPAISNLEDKRMLMSAQFGLCRAYQVKKDLDTALFFGLQGINYGQKMRREMKNPQVLKAFSSTLEDGYQAVADVLMAQGRTAEAQKVMSLLKENELSDMSIGAALPKKTAGAERSGGEQGNAPQSDFLAGLDPKISARYQAISDRVVALGNEQRALLDKQKRGEALSPQEAQRLEELRQDMGAARQAFTAFMSGLTTELAKSGKKSADLGELESYQRLLKSLGEGVVLLQTIVTENNLWLVLTTQSSQTAKKSPLDVATLPEKVAAFRDALQDVDVDPKPLAKEFYDAVIGPLAPALEQAGTKLIMFSLDGQLRYIPMAALWDGKEWLIQKYTVSLFNDAAKASFAVPQQGNWTVAGLGVTKEHKWGRGTFTALPAVKDELNAIVKTPGKDSGVLKGVVTFDEGFTAAKLQQTLETGYPVVHLASHFHFDKKNPERSFLLLGDGKGLFLTNLESQDFKFNNVDLLALSACQTARGGVDAKGKEVEGFGALAQKRGAKAVLATLWPVFDESTGLLMADFYAFHQSPEHPGIAASLRDAQLRMIDNKIKGKDFRHPFYWGPFVVMGDWR